MHNLSSVALKRSGWPHRRARLLLYRVAAICLLVSVVGAWAGCQSKQEQAAQTNGASGSSPAGAKQYRAVCIEKDQHGGNEYVLSKWFDSSEKANEIGKYHGDFKYKGHRWRIDERAKSEHTKP